MLKYYNAVVAVHSSPVRRTFVLLADWLPVHMNETQNRAVPSSFAFYRCVLRKRRGAGGGAGGGTGGGTGGGKGDGTSDGKGKGGGKGGSAHRKLNVPPADTCVLSAAEVVALRETYDFVSVTGCASENDVHAVVHAITKAGRAEYNAAAASNSATVSAASATTPASRAR